MEVEDLLTNLSKSVVLTMRQIPQLSLLPVTELENIPLGRLRRDATRLHAVCRYRKGVRKAEISGPSDVRCVDVHPAALNDDWQRYAAFLLYHEYLHALGFAGHDKTFRSLEALWPDEVARNMGQAFGKHLRKRTAKWLWKCPQCSKEYPRSRRGMGRYRCRECQVTLIDVRAEASGPNA
ncbi:MAG: Protein SprT-like protein [Marine Group II euryarchaeote MED-G33]|nr:MAG: Protein SprT-like protein [Marine Group II euryarchaeote MED-G33]